MSHHRACRVFAVFAVALCVLAEGCQSTSPISHVIARHGPAADVKAHGPVVLAPGMEVEWHVKDGKDNASPVRSGRGLRLGPIPPDVPAGGPWAGARGEAARRIRGLRRPRPRAPPRPGPGGPPPPDRGPRSASRPLRGVGRPPPEPPGRTRAPRTPPRSKRPARPPLPGSPPCHAGHRPPLPPPPRRAVPAGTTGSRGGLP